MSNIYMDAEGQREVIDLIKSLFDRLDQAHRVQLFEELVAESSGAIMGEGEIPKPHLKGEDHES